jgi:hypothetical protein
VQREEVHEIWAPPEGVWSLWVRPVLFAQMPEDAPAGPRPWADLDVSWAPPAAEHVVVVVDLPGQASVHTGLALARRGYRPVPLFNACTGPHEVIEQGSVQRALHDGAADLRALNLPADAPPAFLLDDRRQGPGGTVRPGAFDNRWRVYPEDFPSEDVLLARGLSRVVLVQWGRRQPRDDLALVLWDWQEAGMRVAVKDVADGPPLRPFVVSRPPWPRRLWQRLLAALGWRRSPRGGFGYVIPEPTHG